MNWDNVFKNAHLHSWPTATLCIQNIKPNGANGRNIYEDDEKEIHIAAKKYGYECIGGTKIISFKHPTLKGEAFTLDFLYSCDRILV